MKKNKEKYRQGVIDKISEGWAILLVQNVQGEHQEVVRASVLPGNAKEGDWLILGDDGSLSLDLGTTMEKRARIKAKLDRLRGAK